MRAAATAIAGRVAGWVAPEFVAQLTLLHEADKLTDKRLSRYLRATRHFQGTHTPLRNLQNLAHRQRFRQRYNHTPSNLAPMARYGSKKYKKVYKRVYKKAMKAYRRKARAGRARAREPVAVSRPRGKARAGHWRTAGRMYRPALTPTAQVFPDRQRAVVEWTDIMSVVHDGTGTATAFDTSWHVNNPNDVVDAVPTLRTSTGGAGLLTGHWHGSAAATKQPVGHSSLGIMYKNCRVDKCEVEIKMCRHLDVAPVKVGFQVFPDDDIWQIPALLANREWQSVPFCDGPFDLPPASSGKYFTYRKTIYMNKVVGKSFQDFQDDGGYTAAVGANAAKLIRLRMFVRSQTTLHTTLACDIHTTIKFRMHVTYFNLKDIVRPAALSTGALTQGEVIAIVDPNA